jgi:hypothetical protein
MILPSDGWMIQLHYTILVERTWSTMSFFDRKLDARRLFSFHKKKMASVLVLCFFFVVFSVVQLSHGLDLTLTQTEEQTGM